jgi:hypothetical protein
MISGIECRIFEVEIAECTPLVLREQWDFNGVFEISELLCLGFEFLTWNGAEDENCLISFASKWDRITDCFWVT